MERLKQLLAYLQAVYKIATGTAPGVSGLKIFATAKASLGIDASPNDLALDEFGCAETVTTILNKAGFPMPIIVSTKKLYEYFVQSMDWVFVDTPLPGDVILSPTGMGGKNGIANGHTGIVGDNGQIMSNNSFTGLFESNYTLSAWKKRYQEKGGYPVYYLRKI